MLLTFQNNKIAITMGVGLVMPKEFKPLIFGHMWLWWQEEGLPRQYRGYYPVFDDIDPSIIGILRKLESNISLERGEYISMLRYFSSFKNIIRGHYRADGKAEEVETKFSDCVFKKTWMINEVQIERLKNRMHIPDDANYKLEGFYNWDRKNYSSYNCSCWALETLYHALLDPVFIKCPNPIQIAKVARFIDETIKWDFIPNRYLDEGGRINVKQ